ncbi:hypothetical protein LLG90_08025 [Aromatoleum toluclasticum]|nr:hypothetical protein [Aromatoleum toluclasticum]
MHIDWIRFALILPTGQQIERTVHDVRTPGDLNNRIAALVKMHRPTEQPTPIGLELALDAEHEADDDKALAELAAVMFRMNTGDISKNQRIYRTRGTVTSVPSHERLVAKLLDGWQLGEANEWDDRYRHGYLKVSDDNNRHACRHRARLELRLQGQACPFSTLDELRAFDWTQLREWFRFRRLKDDVSDVERIAAQASTTIGKKRARPRANEGGKREFSQNTLADDDLRNRAYDALRSLNKRWHRAPRRTCDSDISTGIDREKVGSFAPEHRAVAGSVRITTHSEDDSLPNSPDNVPAPNTPDTTTGPLSGAQADRAHRRSGGQAERADGQPFTQQTIERLFDIHRDPVAFIERGSTNRDDAAFLDNLLDEINALSDDGDG